MSNPLVIALIAAVVGVVLGMVLNPLGQRFVQFVLRGLRGVDCDISWINSRGAGGVDSPGGVEVQERQLQATFLNRKDVPVTVSDMRVELYKGGKPLNDDERPTLEFAGSRGGKMPTFELTTLHPRIHATLTVIVTPNPPFATEDPRKQRAVEEADRIEFVAVIDGAKDIRTRLAPWDTLEPQTKRC